MSTRALLWLAPLALIAYLAFWPVPVDPVAWTPSKDPGLSQAPYADSGRLTGAELIDMGGEGPEDLALGPDGALYTGLEDGRILRLPPGGGAPALFAETGGRPLGLHFGPDGTLFIADAYRGLLAVDTAGTVSMVSEAAAGRPIVYANHLTVAEGRVIFSEASTRFDPEIHGGTLEASTLEITDQRGSGRVLEHDLATGETRVLAEGFVFPNGVALSGDGRSVIVAETGRYRLLRIGLEGAARGRTEVLLDGLPGFPDNIERGPDGLFWVGLVSPRAPILDQLAAYPKIRKALFRLPDAVRPGPTRHGMVIAVDESGEVRQSLQDPTGAVALSTAALPTEDGLYISMLQGRRLARLSPAP